MGSKIFLILGVLVFLGCNGAMEENSKRDGVNEATPAVISEKAVMGAYAHSVYVWLQHPESEADRSAFEAAMRKFAAQLSYATSIHFGSTVASDRAVVDDSFTYSFIVTFDQESDLATYENDPAHLAFKAKASKLWSRVVIYDSLSLLD